jgi:hypothetical protein
MSDDIFSGRRRCNEWLKVADELILRGSFRVPSETIKQKLVVIFVKYLHLTNVITYRIIEKDAMII